MSYFEKLRHFVARILDKGRRVRAWISSIFKRRDPIKYHRRHCHHLCGLPLPVPAGHADHRPPGAGLEECQVQGPLVEQLADGEVSREPCARHPEAEQGLAAAPGRPATVHH